MHVNCVVCVLLSSQFHEAYGSVPLSVERWNMPPLHLLIRKSSAVLLRWKQRQTVVCFIGGFCDLIPIPAHLSTLLTDSRLYV